MFLDVLSALGGINIKVRYKLEKESVLSWELFTECLSVSVTSPQQVVGIQVISTTRSVVSLFMTPIRQWKRLDRVMVECTSGALKRQVLENASTEKASTKQRISQGWKTRVRKTQVRICRDGKCKYRKCKYNANLQSDKKSLVFHKLVWWIFKWGGQVDYRLFLSEIT